MKELYIWNLRTESYISRVFLADSFLTRTKGLLGTKKLNPYHGLLIRPCKQVHTLGMRYPISVWFITKEMSVIKIIDNLYPWSISPYVKNAQFVIEFPGGWADRTGTVEGDKLHCLKLVQVYLPNMRPKS